MKYKYFDGHERMIAESDSVIQFNKDLFPAWTDIEPVVENKSSSRSRTNNIREDKQCVLH